jgi:TonB-linked SusC/RagA family outer membrane protein
MRKFASLLAVLMLITTLAFAQTRTVRGRVLDDKGEAVPFASIKIKNSTKGTAADASGNFSIDVPGANTVLVISSQGFNTVEVTATGNTVSAQLTANNQMKEVIVTTALGVSRAKRSLGYAAQELAGEKLSQTKQSDLNTALAGKIAGVQVLGGSGAKFGGSSLRIRGINNINADANSKTDQGPLFVVDGVIVPSTSVNTDDVASLTVLKGPAATNLYGGRGSNGAVVIVTKKGNKKGVGIEVNQSSTFERVYTLPEYQNEYAGGYSQTWNIFHYNPATDKPALAAMDGAKYYDYFGDESWGPKMDGTLYAPWYAWDPTDVDYAKQKPLVPQPDNVRDFYEQGRLYNTNIAFSKSGDVYSTRFSYTNIDRRGITPNSSQKRNYLNFFASFNPFARLTLSTNVSANFVKSVGIPDEGYGTQTAGSFNQWFHRDLETDKLKRYKRPDGSYTTWNINGPRNLAAKYWDNPYTEAYENFTTSNSSRLFGNITATYAVTNDLKASFIARGNFSNGFADGRTASFTLSTASYSTSQSRDRENNYIWSLDYNKIFGDISFKAAAFAEVANFHTENISMNTVGGFTIPNYFNIAASKDRPGVKNETFDEKIRSVYGYISTGYKNMVFLDLNLRNDEYSTLPAGNNSKFYPGVSTSFVFTELMKKNPILSFGRIRGSYATNAARVGPYSIHQTYSPAGLYGSTPAMTVPNQIPNEELKPALASTYEAGTELRFANNRIRFDFNFYYRSNEDQIISLTIPSTTGFSSALVNAGKITNKGYEISLGGTPIDNKTITWDIDANIGINRNKIVELYPGINNFVWASFGFVGSPAIRANREVGKPFGTLIGQGFKRDANGNVLIDDNGFPLKQDDVNFGSFLPDFTGGFTNSLSYKRFTLGFSLDFQVGGKLMSITRMFTAGSGLSKETAGLNEKGKPKRDDPATGGGVLFPGIVESTGKPNDIYVDAQTLYESELFSLWENWVYDATYVKLREVSLGYSIPEKIASKIKAKGITVSVIAQNPWLIYTAVKGIDPSQLEGNWNEGGQLPGTRSIGFNVKFNF